MADGFSPESPDAEPVGSRISIDRVAPSGKIARKLRLTLADSRALTKEQRDAFVDAAEDTFARLDAACERMGQP
ncbi:MAG: hypothetical protein WC700_14285 [Gemmatimonadaceae bacterium]|jgi:hypothetical protein